jgi:hypothetical protein
MGTVYDLLTRGFTVPLTTVSWVHTGIRFLEILLLFYYFIYYMRGKSVNYVKVFIHFWSVHRPFVIFWSGTLTLETCSLLLSLCYPHTHCLPS